MKKCLENQATEKVLIVGIRKDDKQPLVKTEFEAIFNKTLNIN